MLGTFAVVLDAIRRRLPGPRLAETALGLLSGAVAILQMMSPIEPVEGLPVDLRQVPVVLAGAVPGPRGLLACLLLGCAMTGRSNVSRGPRHA